MTRSTADVTGVSGVVADGVQWPDGSAYKPASAEGWTLYRHDCGASQLFGGRPDGFENQCDYCEWQPVHVRADPPTIVRSGESNMTRRFELHRAADVTGVSGTGIVADGVEWPDGSATIRWRGPRPSVVYWLTLADAIAIHGHDGRTRIEWIDAADGGTPGAVYEPVSVEGWTLYQHGCGQLHRCEYTPDGEDVCEVCETPNTWQPLYVRADPEQATMDAAGTAAVVAAARAWRAIQERPARHGDADIERDLVVAVDTLDGAEPCICRPHHRPDDLICRHRPAPDGNPDGVQP